jgi:hypothetical protein
MPWIERPERGWIAGTVRPQGAAGNDALGVTVKRRRFWPFGGTIRLRTDGNGYFAVANVRPGRYTISVRFDGDREHEIHLRVAAGRVSRADF